MSEIEKIIEGINLPKQIIDKSETLVKKIFGPSFDEYSGMLADNVRLRRFNNQIKILSKAEKKLKEQNIDPKKVSLKILAPLVEFSSLEEDENIQEKWSNLICEVVKNDNDNIFQKNSIEILSKISSEDAIYLDKLYSTLQMKRKARYQQQLKTYGNNEQLIERYVKKPENQSLEDLLFSVNETSKILKISSSELKSIVSYFVTLGLLKWETDVEVTASKYSSDPEDTDIDVDVNVYNNDDFIFTEFGNKFVKICKG